MLAQERDNIRISVMKQHSLLISMHAASPPPLPVYTSVNNDDITTDTVL